MKFSKSNLTNILIISIAAIIFAYVFYRASQIALTYDESYTYLIFQKSSIKDILLLHDYSGLSSRMLANNHIINTLLVKLSVLLFGNSELAIRLPNVLFFGLYLWFAGKISLRWRVYGGVLSIAMFILLITNPFVLDIFSMSRGYGISLAFMMVGIYYLLEHISENKNSVLFKAIVFFGLATLANFSFLYLYTSVFLIVLLHSTFGKKVKITIFLKQNLKLIFFFTITFLIAFIYSLFLKEKDQLYYGGDINFWSDTISSLIHFSLYFPKDTIPSGTTALVFKIINIFVAIILITSLINSVYIFKKKVFNSFNKEFLGIFALFALPSIASIGAFYLLDNKYLKDRTGVFLIPIFMFLVIYNILLLENNFKITKKIIYGIFLVLSISITFNFARTFNTNHFARFIYTADTKEAAVYISQNYSDNTNLSVRGNLRYGMMYYKEKLKLDKLNVYAVEDIATESNIDLILVDPYYYDTLKQYAINLKEVKRFSTFGSVLYEVQN